MKRILSFVGLFILFASLAVASRSSSVFADITVNDDATIGDDLTVGGNIVDGESVNVRYVSPQQVAAVPAQPHACDASHLGQLIYVDDSNDTTESYLCFCGLDADDTTHIWLKVADPTANCF